VAGMGAGAYYYLSLERPAADTDGAARSGGRGGFGGPGFGFGGGPRLPMTVEVARVKRADMTARLTVVGSLIGAATVEAVPKVAGRLEAVFVRLGDPVSRGQRLAKIEDNELLEQIRQREADLQLAQTNLNRARNLFERQLIPRQTYDDTDAGYQAAAAQLDLAKAQFSQADARLNELKINLSNTVLTSPVSGFIGRRLLDPGAWVTPNSSFISVVDISTVRLVANIVERDLRKVSVGMKADVSVDAYPGEAFAGRIANVAPVLDPSTRTAQVEIEIENPKFRLKPGMYANVNFTTEHRENTLVVPTNAVVDVNGSRGVFLPAAGDTATFKPVTVGMIDSDLAEVSDGLSEGDRIVTTGAAALREGDRIILAGQGREGGGGRGERQNEVKPVDQPRPAESHQEPAGARPRGGRAGGATGRERQS
jgi:membrane fusion protein (multidrug efflux system)